MERDFPSTSVRRVGLAVADPGSVDRAAVRESLGIVPETALMMHLGFLTPEKGMLDILTSLAAAVKAGHPVHLMVVGEGTERSRMDHAINALGLSSHVSMTGWVSTGEFEKLPAAADLGVVLRTPSAGETSAAALRFLACGTPVAVSGLNQFLEWPEAAAPRITPGPSTVADLTRLLGEVSRGGTAWRERREAARGAYEEEHRPTDVAPRFIKALRELIG
jgi:glycosyltransferase involved in cell wall biosynthesis